MLYLKHLLSILNILLDGISHLIILEDTIIRLYYEVVDRIYTATFYNHDGTIYHEIMANYGQFITEPLGPNKPMTEQFYYELLVGIQVLIHMSMKTEILSVYESHLRHFNVTFLDGNGNVFDEQLVAYGQTPDRPNGTPVKRSNCTILLCI